MDLSNLLEKIDEEKNGVKKKLKLSREISGEAAPYFEEIGVVNWFFYFFQPDNNEYMHVGKSETKYHNLGLEAWGKSLLIHGCKIFKEYKGIEKCLNNISEKWLCLMEINDELIILSSIPNRSNMISLLAM